MVWFGLLVCERVVLFACVVLLICWLLGFSVCYVGIVFGVLGGFYWWLVCCGDYGYVLDRLVVGCLILLFGV